MISFLADEIGEIFVAHDANRGTMRFFEKKPLKMATYNFMSRLFNRLAVIF